MSDQIEQAQTPRRHFVVRLLAGAGALAVVAGIPQRLAGETPRGPNGEDDWMRELKGNQRPMAGRRSGKRAERWYAERDHVGVCGV